MLRLSRQFSTAETVRLIAHSSQESPVRDRQSYVTRRLEELVDERPVVEVLLKELGAGDSLTIQTEHSSYTFMVLDPLERTGILTGGKLKRHMMRVTLVGSLDEREQSIGKVRDEPGRLQIGAQAVFYLKSAQCIRRITTSPVKHILHIRGPR